METILKNLKHPKWQIRNVAVKKLGFNKSAESAKALTQIIEDRRPSSWWMRLLGEPFFQVGFIRRNAWVSLREQTIDESIFFKNLFLGLSDPYYEVRCESYNTLKAHVERGEVKPGSDLCDEIFSACMKEEVFEVLRFGIAALSLLVNREQALSMIKKYKKAKHWRVREAILQSIDELIHRGALHHSEALSLVEHFNFQSEYFKPVFLLKEKKAKLDKTLAAESGE